MSKETRDLMCVLPSGVGAFGTIVLGYRLHRNNAVARLPAADIDGELQTAELRASSRYTTLASPTVFDRSALFGLNIGVYPFPVSSCSFTPAQDGFV